MTITREAFRFFLENAGYCVGSRAQGAINLARAEADAKKLGITFEWAPEMEPYDGAGCCEDVKRHAQYLRNDGRTMEARWLEREHMHDAEWCAARYKGETLASLGMIADADRTYRRVVQAELAMEALAALDESMTYAGMSVEGSRV